MKLQPKNWNQVLKKMSDYLKKSVRDLVLGCLLLTCIGILSSCGKNTEGPIGDRLYSPFDMVRINRWNEYIVLNSNYDGFYRDGSLMRLADNGSGGWNKKQILSIPRLGTRMAVDAKESKVALAFTGDKSEILIYSLGDDSINPQQTSSLVLSDDLVITDIDWVNSNGQSGSRELLIVELGGNNSTGKVRIYEQRDSGLKPLFTIPDDLPNARNPVYELGHSAAVYEPGSNMLVFMPSGGAGTLGEQASPYEVGKTGIWTATGDSRAVSIVAVDLDNYFATQNLLRSSAYFPVVLNDSFVQGNFDLPANDPVNTTLKYRTLYTEATLAKGTGCASVIGDLAADTVLAALSGNGHVLSLTGWAALKASLAAKGLQSDEIADHFFTKELKISPYSLGSGVGSLPKETSFRVTALRSISYGSDGACLPVIARAEIRTTDSFLTNAGRENIWVAHSLGRDASNPVVGKVPERSAVRFAGTSSDLFFVSYSNNSISRSVVGEQGFTFDSAFRD
jgi:hypothetical protein